ncbi:MAG: AI-2E family transporter [Planctomycetaceae bacterium]|nr:AI-2E family transporter [Planctomycetaceae bacterium]
MADIALPGDGDPNTVQPPPPPSNDQTARFHRTFLLIVLILTGLLFVWIINYFLVAIIVAGSLATLFNPLNLWLRRILRNHNGLAAFVTCIILLLGLIIPAVIVADKVVEQAVSAYQTAQDTIQNWIEQGEEGWFGRLRNSRLVRWIHLQNVELGKIFEQGIQGIGTGVAAVVNILSKNVIGFFTKFLIILFTMFYFFRDGEHIVQRLKDVSPMNERYEQAIIKRFRQISQATVRGTVLVGLTQGMLGALTLWLTGVSGWLLAGVIMALLAMIPPFGPYVILIPIGIIQLLSGHYIRGIIIMVAGIVIIGSIDNLMRPRVVGRSARMHDLVIFFSTLGGIGVFGILGFIVGPVIAALFTTILDIYTVEFQGELERSDKIQVQ